MPEARHHGTVRRRLIRALISVAVAGFPDGAGAETRQRKDASGGALVYQIRPDFQTCEASTCDGWLVRAVNLDETRCADGTSANECRVAALEPKGKGAPDRETLEALLLAPASERALLRGTLEAGRANRAPAVGVLRVIEAWEPAGTGEDRGSLFLVRDAGIRCVKAPCPSMRASLVNADRALRIEEIDLAPAMASAAELARAADALGDGGILVAGSPSPGSTPDADVLLGARFYLRVGRDPSP